MAKLIKNTIKDIWTSKLRSLLTIFGIVVGIASVTVMVSIGESSQKFIEQSLSNQMDESVLAVTLGEDSSGIMVSPTAFIGSFSQKDYEILTELSNENDEFTVARVGMEEMTLSYANRSYSAFVLIIDPEYHVALNSKFTAGEKHHLTNPRANKAKLIVGRTFAKDLFSIQDPIGKKVQLNGREHTIRGVVDRGTEQMTQGMNISNITFNNYVELYGKEPSISSFLIDVKNPEDLKRIQKEIEAALRISRGIDFGETKDFSVQSQEDLLEKTREITGALKLFITVISSISLFVGGVGIMNIMLVSIKERVKEFGLRKAIGASNTDIMQQIIMESIVFSIIGAIVGSLAGNVFALIIQAIAGLPPLVSINAIISSVVVSTVVGVVFGFYPALTAAKLSPIEALRAD